LMETGLAGTVSIRFVIWDRYPFNRANLTNVNESETEKGRISYIDNASGVKIGFTLFSTPICGSPKEG
jgi:hypothetical protein